MCRQCVAGDARVDSVSPVTSEHLRLALYRITDTATLVEGVRNGALATEIDGDTSRGQVQPPVASDVRVDSVV